MALKTIQDILPLVDKPSRDLGKENNTSKKYLYKIQRKISLAFTDIY
jgi:hypothetical protein